MSWEQCTVGACRRHRCCMYLYHPQCPALAIEAQRGETARLDPKGESAGPTANARKAARQAEYAPFVFGEKAA